MNRKTKKFLFSSLIDSSLGLILLGTGLALATPILIYVGAGFLGAGLVGVAISSAKASAETKNRREMMQNRDMLVEHSFGPVTENTQQNENITEQNNKKQVENQQDISNDKKLYSAKAKLGTAKNEQNKDDSISL
ncbi:MAG: hypothetical protein J6Q51_00740 [Clostridia bacterium]|nr:hypothetical protein [Clostridia bacterium]